MCQINQWFLFLCWVTQTDVDSGRLGAQRVWLWQLSHYLCLLWPLSHISRATHLAFPASSDHPEAISKGFICPSQIGTTHHHGCWSRHTCVCVCVVVSRTDHVGPKTVVFCEESLLSKGTLDKIIIRLLGERLRAGAKSTRTVFDLMYLFSESLWLLLWKNRYYLRFSSLSCLGRSRSGHGPCRMAVS